MDRFDLESIAGCRPFINNVALGDIITPIEQRLGVSGPGHYMWLPPSLALLPSRHLLGTPDPASGMWGEDWADWGFGNHKVAIGGCLCGDVGCRPLLVTIELNRSVVVWRDFVSRHFDAYHLGFTFQRTQYESQLRSGSQI
jgi:hypothetical protein